MMLPYLGETATAKKIEKAIADMLPARETRTDGMEGRSSATDVSEAIVDGLG
jgi:isocitrate/isopropylmalate dehydrogenase